MRWLVLMSLLAACGDSASIEFSVGAELELSASSLPVPGILREDGPSGAIVRVSECGPMGMCATSSEVPISCVADVCDPDARTVSFPVGDVYDLDELAGDAGAILTSVDRLEVLGAEYRVQQNTLTIPTEAVEVFWAPAGAVALSPEMGAQHFGTLPATIAGRTSEGDVTLVPAGQQGFSAHYADGNHQFRLFARTTVDLDPGGAFPEGALSVQLVTRVRIFGSVL